MKIIDSHFHWLPRSLFEQFTKREGYPQTRPNNRGGYDYMGAEDRGASLNSWADWFDLGAQLQYMDSLGHEIGVVCSTGPFSICF